MTTALIPKAERGVFTHQFTTLGYSVHSSPIELIQPKLHCDVLVIAGQHGTEPETTLLLSYALRMISIEDLVCPVLLCLNPDGIKRGTRGNANGVDLNRNFPTQDWRKTPVKHRWEEDEEQIVELSPGATPASEPETQALLKLIDEGSFTTVVSIHSPLNCVDDPEESVLGKRLARELDLPLVSDIGYPTPGSFGTWGKENNLSVITIELPYIGIKKLRARYQQKLVELLCGQYF